MVNVVEKALDVSFDEPLDSIKAVAYIVQCGMAASTGTESVGRRQKYRFIYCFQYHSKYFLHELIRECRNSQRPQSAIAFRDIRSAHRRWDITSVRQRFNDSFYLSFTKAVCRIRIYPSCGSALIGI